MLPKPNHLDWWASSLLLECIVGRVVDQVEDSLRGGAQAGTGLRTGIGFRQDRHNLSVTHGHRQAEKGLLSVVDKNLN